MKSKLSLIYNPFARIAGWPVFGIGIVIVFISVIIAAHFNQYYQGVFNIRLVSEISISNAFIHQGIGLLSMLIVFFLTSIILAKGTRIQDILGVITLARAPYIFPAFFGAFVNKQELNSIMKGVLEGNYQAIMFDFISMTVFGLFMLVILVWYIALLWNGYHVSTGLKGAKAIVSFIVALILSDICYYLLLYSLKSNFLL